MFNTRHTTTICCGFSINGGREMIETIIKRDGRAVPFSIDKIANAIFQAAKATGGNDYEEALVNLGYCYMNGTGVKADPQQALACFQEAYAKKSMRAALFEIAHSMGSVSSPASCAA